MVPSGKAIELVSNSGFNPRFTWQVGIGNDEILIDDLRFRATVRPLGELSQWTRWPSSEVLYEETGIYLNTSSGIGYWEFPLSTNLSLPGGPFRSYQVVIEAHDENGFTSAGNMVGQTGEVGWSPYPLGYDIIGINNQRYSGMEPSLVVPTQFFVNTGFTSVTGTHSTYQYFSSDGSVSIEVLSGNIDNNLIGGYLYLSTGKFPKHETLIRSGIWGQSVQRTRFDFNPLNKRIFSQNAAINVRDNPYVYAGISFYDALDDAFLRNGVDISTGLALSNNFVIFNNSFFSSMGAGSLFVKRVSGLATGLSDPIILSGLTNGESPVSYVNVGDNTNIICLTETYLNNPTYTGIPEIPSLSSSSSIGGVSNLAVSNMVMTLTPDVIGLTQYTSYYHSGIGEFYLASPDPAVASRNLKASGDALGIIMSGNGEIRTSFSWAGGGGFNPLITLTTTYTNGNQSVESQSVAFGAPSSPIVTFALDSSSGVYNYSSSRLISDVITYQKLRANVN